MSISICAYDERQYLGASTSGTTPKPVQLEEDTPSRFQSTSHGNEESESLPSGHNRLGSQEGAPSSSVRRKEGKIGGSPIVNPPPPVVPTEARKKPKETYVILRQWGADITVFVLPPFHRKVSQSSKHGQNSQPKPEHASSSNSILNVPVPTPFASQNPVQNGQHSPAKENGTHRGSHRSNHEWIQGASSSASSVKSTSHPRPPLRREDTAVRMLPDVGKLYSLSHTNFWTRIRAQLIVFQPHASSCTVYWQRFAA